MKKSLVQLVQLNTGYRSLKWQENSIIWGEAKIERSRDILAQQMALTSTRTKIFFPLQ